MTDLDLSVIMPSYLGAYDHAAKDRQAKLHRAVFSFLASTGSFLRELILVSDGCDETDKYFRVLAKSYGGSGEPSTEVKVLSNVSVRHLRIDKQPGFAGRVRNRGLDIARGNYIAYLDSDDMVTADHFADIVARRGDYDWIYFDDLLWPAQYRARMLKADYIGTSCFAHRRSLGVRWNDAYASDWALIQQLMREYPNHAHVGAGGYIVCHVPGQIDM